MQAVTLQQAQLDLAGLISNVIADAEPMIICTDSGEQIVCVSLDEYNSWKETIYLLSSPANAQHLRHSIAQADAGDAQPRELLKP